MNWSLSHRFDSAALPMADRHYNRQKPGTPQFVPPGRCLVLKSGDPVNALWVTSWPFARYTKHEWAGAWVNSLFRNESRALSSDSILSAVAATRWHFGEPPELGMVTFVNPFEVPGVCRRGEMIYGYCYLMAGFEHVGFTQGGLWVWQLLPSQMPDSKAPIGAQLHILRGAA